MTKKASSSTSAWRPSRRDVLFLGIGGLVAAVPIARRQPPGLIRRHVVVMGTIAEFAVAHRDPARAHAAIDAAVAALRHVDAAMSRFKPSSDVGRANVGAADGPVSIAAETNHVLQEALQWAADTCGVFDPCLGRAVTLWDVAHRREPPADSAVAALAKRQLYRSLELGTHRGEPVVLFRDADVMIDLGGIAKGYAVDRAVAALREQGIDHALVGAGGDLYALGHSPSGEPWHVGVQSPDHIERLAASLSLEDAAVATSGDYQQFFVHRNRRYHHLLDAETGAPRITPQRSVSIIAPTCMAADAGATFAFCATGIDAEGILAKHGGRIAHAI